MILTLIHNVYERLRKIGHHKEQSPQADPELSQKANPKYFTSVPEEPSVETVLPGTKRRRRRSPKRKRSPNGKGQHKSSGSEILETQSSDWNLEQFDVAPADDKVRFHDLELPIEVMHAVADMGFQYCTPIQAAILPKLLTGVDATGRAQTGTGKSAAFLIHIITQLMRNSLTNGHRNGTPRALILAPTRELVLQIEKEARALGKYAPCNIVAVFGGKDYEKQKQMLTRQPVDILAATPGRLLDFVQHGQLHLGKTEFLVIDEADRMLDMGFIPDVRKIIRKTPPKTSRQTMFFSATLTPEVTRLASQWTKDPVIVEIEPEQVASETVERVVYLTTIEEKFTVLVNLIVQKKLDRVLIFGNRRDQTRQLTENLKRYGIRCALLSGEVRQTKRIKALEDFRAGKISVLVATDVAARGLHIDDISHVINYNLPIDPEAYVHRIGRTGRAGASGVSISFATEDDSFQIPGIEEYIGQPLPCSYPDDELLKPLPEPRKRTAAHSHSAVRTPRKRPARNSRRTRRT